MNRTPYQWNAFVPTIDTAGATHARNTLRQAIADITELARENERLAAELATAKKVAGMRLVAMIEGVKADGVVG